jgi:membrane fusion protein, multidrug efflux system
MNIRTLLLYLAAVADSQVNTSNLREKRMGHFNSTNIAEPVIGEDQEGQPRSHAPASQVKSHKWLWFLAVAAIAVFGFWYFRYVRTSTAAQAGGQTAAGPGGGSSAKGQGRGPGGPGGFVVPVVVATAQKGDLPIYFNGLGTVTAFNTVMVRTRVDGQIVKINFQEGQMVHQGDDLVDIDSRPYQVQLEQAEGQLAKDQAQLRDVQVDYQRYQLLYKEGVIPKQQVDTQQAQVGQYEGAIKSDQGSIDNAKLQIIYAHITAPISGRVGLRLVDIGNIVHASDQNGLLVITQLQPIAVIFALPQDQLPQVAVKLRNGGQLPVDAYDRDNTMKIESGKLLTIDNQIDTTTGTYKLKSVFNNSQELLFPNQFVNVHLLVDIKRNLVIVPTAAIQRGPQGTYVYVVQNGNTAKIQNVTVALTADNSTGVSSGLSAGDVIVTDGQDKLQDGSKVNPTTSPTGATNAQNANGAQQPAAELGNTQTGSGRRGRGAGQSTQPAQQGHPSGKSQ